MKLFTMRNVESHLLDGKMDETVTHYITSHHPGEPVHVDGNGLTLNVQDDGGGRVVTVMHPHNFSSNMCRQMPMGETVIEGSWGEELLDTDGRLAALVAHLAQHSRLSHPPQHMKITSVRGDIDSSVILDTPVRLFNGSTLDHSSDSALVVDVPPLPPLPPLQEMKRCQETDWFSNKTKTILKEDGPMLQEADERVLELGAASSPAQHKHSKKSLPHKKRISRKLRRNNGSSTPQQGIVVINCSEEVPQEILPDNFVTSVQHQQHLPETSHHIPQEMRAIFICQICGDFYGEEQLKFYHHLKQHYEPHSAIIIENPVPDIAIDKMTSTCIVDNVANLPDSIVELSLENTVPKTMYQPMDKHILYAANDKTINYQTSKPQYPITSMKKEQAQNAVEERSELYESLDKLQFYSCLKCNELFKKQKQCEAHIKEEHFNNKFVNGRCGVQLDDMGEFSEPEDLMEGIHVTVEEPDHNEQAATHPPSAHSAYSAHPAQPAHPEQTDQHDLPTLTVDNGHVHQDHYVLPQRTFSRATNASNCPQCPSPEPVPEPPSTNLKEETLQRIFETEVSNETNFAETIIPDTNTNQEPEPPKGKQATPKKKAQNNKFECVQCSRTFVHRNSLIYHMLSHSGKQHPCQQCGKGFYTITALKIHERVHSGDRPCKCDECGREFRQWSDLKYHKNSIHSNQKPFKCDYCGKEFARKYSLSLHRRIHTGERNYKCEYCNKSFRASSYRLSHMRTHTGIRPFKCNECEKCFRVAGDLRRHALIHEKLRKRSEEIKAKEMETKEKDDREESTVIRQEESKNTKKVAAASTTRLPSIVRAGVKKTDKPVKKSTLKKGAPNVTVSDGLYKMTEYANNVEVFDPQQEEHYTKFKEVYSDSAEYKIKDYSDQVIYKDSVRLNDDRELIFRSGQLCESSDKHYRENTDGKLQIFTQVEKSKDYSGPIVSNTVSLGDIRHLERDVVREGRPEGMHGEQIESVFLDKLAVMYNLSA